MGSVRLPQFSEFSFGYALTDNLIHGGLPKKLKAAPTFPSLYKEGKPGGGYDVEIPLASTPLFLQFKVPQILTRKSKKTPPSFDTPYYRMHVRPSGQSLQHQNLLIHERRHRLVYYVTPRFHTTAELNKAFLDRRMVEESVFIRPSQIGSLDDQDHFVAYDRLKTVGWLFSEPHTIQGSMDSHKFIEDLQLAVDRAVPPASSTAFFDTIAKEVIATYEESAREIEIIAREQHWQRRDQFSPTWQGYEETIEQNIRAAREEAINRYQVVRERFGIAGGAAYMARFYLDCELIIVGKQS